MLARSLFAFAIVAFATAPTRSQDTFESWPPLRSTFPSTGGGGITIKGYDPVVTGNTCVTTFMAVEQGPDPKVYPSFITFEATAMQGGILCHNGKWRAFDGGASGTTPYRVFFKDGIFHGQP